MAKSKNADLAVQNLIQNLERVDAQFRRTPAKLRHPVCLRLHAVGVLKYISDFLMEYHGHITSNIVINQIIETFELAQDGKIGPMAFVPGGTELVPCLSMTKERMQAQAAAVLEYGIVAHKCVQEHWAKKIADTLEATGFKKTPNEPYRYGTIIRWRQRCDRRKHPATETYTFVLDILEFHDEGLEWALKTLRQAACDDFGPASPSAYRDYRQGLSSTNGEDKTCSDSRKNSTKTPQRKPSPLAQNA